MEIFNAAIPCAMLECLRFIQFSDGAYLAGLSFKTPAGYGESDVRSGRVDNRARTVEPVIDRRGSVSRAWDWAREEGVARP